MRAAQRKLTEPMAASQMRQPQRFVERLEGSVPNRIKLAHGPWRSLCWFNDRSKDGAFEQHTLQYLLNLLCQKFLFFVLLLCSF